MKNLPFGTSLVLALIMSGLGAGGCTENGDSVTGTHGDGGGLIVTIAEPTSEPGYSTICNSVPLSGSVSMSGTGSGDELAGVTVTWRNETTGGSGRAFESVFMCDFLGYAYVCFRWSATVALALGENRITITASHPAGWRGERSTTVNKSGPSYSIVGKVVNQSAIALGLTKLALAGNGTSTDVYTGRDGSYAFSCVANGSYDLTPSSLINYAFSPLHRVVTVADANVTGQHFSAEAYLLSGKVTYSSGVGVSVLMTLTGPNSSAIYVAEADGSYLFLVPNGTYTVQPYCSLQCPSFTPASRTITVDHADVPGQDFTVTAPTSTTRAPPGPAAR